MAIPSTRVAAYALWATTVLGPLTLNAAPACGQSPAPASAPVGAEATPRRPATYGPLEAGQDAYVRGEAERRAAIARQLQTLDNMAWYSGLPGWRTPPNLESMYAYPRTWRSAPSGEPTRGAYPSASRDTSRQPVFEPWPLVPGDIYGYPHVDRIAQPIGHEIVVTGPNSYLYRPVYSSEGRSPPARPPAGQTLPAPPRASPPAVSAPVPDVRKAVPSEAGDARPQPSAKSGPQEF